MKTNPRRIKHLIDQPERGPKSATNLTSNLSSATAHPLHDPLDASEKVGTSFQTTEHSQANSGRSASPRAPEAHNTRSQPCSVGAFAPQWARSPSSPCAAYDCVLLHHVPSFRGVFSGKNVTGILPESTHTQNLHLQALLYFYIG